jgi:lysophospholipase L1-like esterase
MRISCILTRMLYTFRRFRGLFLVPLCAASLYSASPQAHRVSAYSDLKPLTLSIGGRVLPAPSLAASGFGAHDLTSQWPGTYFRAAFRGSRVFFRVGKSEEILHVVVDNKVLLPVVKPAAGVYEIDGLSDAPHTVSVSVATESQAAPNTFGGIAIPIDEQALPPPRRLRQMEFIGDSHTVGYGNLSPRHECSKDDIWADTDNTSAFGPVAAAHYGAEYQVNAISGRGVVRNYNGFAADTLPQAYPYVLLDHAHQYADAAWKPQVLVIALGTNDFSTALNVGERWKTRDELHADFETTYVRFLQRLRVRNPTAYLLVWATDVANGEVEAEAKRVVDQVRKQGDNHISFLPIDKLGFGACDEHPSLADERFIAQDLMKLIDADKQVWPTE